MKYYSKRKLVEAVSGRDIISGNIPEWLKEMEADGRFETKGECIYIDIGISSVQVAKDDMIVMEDGKVRVVGWDSFINDYETAERY